MWDVEHAISPRIDEDLVGREFGLCACGAGIGLASVGLAVVHEESSYIAQHSPRGPMTAVASYQPVDVTSTPNSTRSASEGRNGKVRPGRARIGQKRTLEPRASFAVGLEEPQRREEDRSMPDAETTHNRSQSWLRRFSSSMSSRESSRTPTSRPGSAAVSNASITFSNTGSTTPIFSGAASSPLPNKLVKRATSLRNSNGSLQSSGSRLPIPVFRRPATSHDRSASLQQTHSGTDHSDHMSIDEDSPTTREGQFRQYFKPRIAPGMFNTPRRRSSSGIPKPIKRVYPDRSYTPILVSAKSIIEPAHLGVDDEEDVTSPSGPETAYNAASSPLPAQDDDLQEGEPPRRSFSITDLLSTGPQPLWRPHNRPKNSKGKPSRRERLRVVSAPQPTMGNSLSNRNGNDSERPAKRRDLTDHQLASRSIYSSSSSNQHMDIDGHEIQLNLGRDAPPSSHIQAPSPLPQHRLPSAAPYSAAQPARVSAAHSEFTSTVDSDSEYRSIGDDSTDYQSDAIYDSYRTRTTRSSSGRRGPHIEKIFDDSPLQFSSERSTKLKDLLSDGGIAAGELGQYRNSTIQEEEGSVNTPVRSLRDSSVTSTPSVRPGAQQQFRSSPPVLADMAEDDEIDWDAFDEDNTENGHATEHFTGGTLGDRNERSLPFRFGLGLQQPHSASSDVTPIRQNGGNTDRTKLFDWSEAQPSPSASHTPPRPKTMQGKKGAEGRGSRSAGRRAPSGMHARSHSVPVVPDVDGRRSNVVANKFGTWGVGSKVITEDWNEDFDFDDAPAPVPGNLDFDERRVDSGHGMFVPQSIREQQQSVLTNISLLREWGLLIEELKELRIRAVALDMMNGPYAGDWQEVDAMIDLADQETEEDTLQPRRTPPSSPNFDYGAFEETSNNTRPRGNTGRMSDTMIHETESPIGFTRLNAQTSTSQHPFTGRDRKDSEAVARSVIKALQSRRSVSDPTTAGSATPSKKVPFDTATLRHIVPHVDRLKRKVKEGLRATEDLRTSPHRPSGRTLDFHSNHNDNEEDVDRAFRNIFNEPRPNEELARRGSRRDQAATDYDGSQSSPMDQRFDLANRMQSMNLPR